MLFRKVIDFILQINQIRFIKYIYLNYFCKAVQRNGKGKIIPYKNSLIDLADSSKIILGDEDVQIGTNKLKGSKTETYIRLRQGACWNANEGCLISYGATIEVLQNAVLDTKYFTMNSFSVLIAANKITLGKDVMIGRNVIIYDSDFHSVNENCNISKPVIIGNHVWIATNSIILKGVSIGNGSMIAANTLISNDISDDIMVASKQGLDILKENIKWKR